MKVAVITRHSINNYGSLLQALATQTVIESLGHSCEIIDYIRKDETYQMRERTSLQNKPNWNKNLLKRILYLVLRQPESLASGKRFEKMQQQYLHLTRRYSSREELIADKPVADCYVTGSDQVWGPMEDGTYDDCYCLSFTEENDIRFSYAASFGHTEFSTEIEKYYVKWLGRYNRLLVREDSAVERISAWGLNAKQVVDPTLLLPKEFWKSFINNKQERDKYILIYQLHNNSRLGRYAKKLAKKKGIRLIRVSQSLHQITREGKLVWCPDLFKFLSLIDGAECIITDSFHGTALAINLNTPFIEVLPNNNTGTRNMSILRLTGLTDRILGDEDNYEIMDTAIDFNAVNKVIDNERTISMTLLNDMLKSEK